MYNGPFFSLGFGKCGTVSLAAHLNKHFEGVKAEHHYISVEKKFKEWEQDQDAEYTKYWEDGTAYFDSFSMRRRWRLLHAKIPNARFILTVRPLEEYIKSCLIHVAYDWHTGGAWKSFNTDAESAWYKEHLAEVLEAAKQEPDRFLVLHLGAWSNARLAAFFKARWTGGPASNVNSSIAKLRRLLKDYSNV